MKHHDRDQPGNVLPRPVYTDIGKALGTDYFLLKEHLTQDERAYLERARRFVEDEVLPVINGYWERADGHCHVVCGRWRFEPVGRVCWVG